MDSDRAFQVSSRKEATAFFIAHFDQRSHFVFRAFENGIARAVSGLDRQIRLQRVDLLPAEPDLVSAIKGGLNSAVFAACDITPGGEEESPQWNPNVFYELGMAEQLGLPSFLVCDKDRKPGKNARLPFDIASRAVEFYEFTPDGLESLTDKFEKWLFKELNTERGRVSAYEQSQPFVRVARGIKSDLYHWRGASAPSFRQLLARMVTPLKAEAAKMTNFLHESSSASYRFEPPRRADAVEQLFIAMIDSLEPGDEYLTLSTIPFWRSFRDDGEAYREACRKAAERGVHIRRLLMIPDECTEIENRLVRAHVRVHQQVESYELRILSVPRPQSLRPYGHVGVCHRKSLRVTTAFEPDYDGVDDPKIIGIRLRNDAEHIARDFEETWKKTPALDKSKWYA